MWERAEKQLSRTTDKKVAEMLHFGRFGETPWGKGGTGGGTPCGKRPQPRRQPRAGPPSGASAAGRAAYDKDVKGKRAVLELVAPWKARCVAPRPRCVHVVVSSMTFSPTMTL